MARNDDAYRRELDLIFQEIDDRAALAREQDLVGELERFGSSPRETRILRQRLEKFAMTSKKMAESEAHAWANTVLERLIAALK
jgi:hypothetical protein